MNDTYKILLIMISTLFGLGFITFSAGLLILVTRAAGKDVQNLATQTARLAQKGLAEDITGLVNTVNNLLDTLNQMMRTTGGIGIFLNLLGLLLMGSACWFAIQLYQLRI